MKHDVIRCTNLTEAEVLLFQQVEKEHFMDLIDKVLKTPHIYDLNANGSYNNTELKKRLRMIYEDASALFKEAKIESEQIQKELDAILAISQGKILNTSRYRSWQNIFMPRMKEWALQLQTASIAPAVAAPEAMPSL